MTQRRGKGARTRAAPSDRAMSGDAEKPPRSGQASGAGRPGGATPPAAAPPSTPAATSVVPPDPDAITPVEEMDLVGGAVCLELVNTGAGRRLGPFREKLRGYDDLVTWAERLELIDEDGGAELRRAARREPAVAEDVLERARALREAIYRVFITLGAAASEPAADASPAAADASPAAADLERIGEEGVRAAAARRLVALPDGVAFEWRADSGLERPLLAAALSAVELLTAGDVSRVKECASENCNWLFVDESRNRSRRWCDMKDCGNRAKARRFRQRSRPR